MPSDKAMEPSVWFIENADPDTVGAIALIANPKLKALFWIDIPFVNPMVIRQGTSLSGGFVEADGLPRTRLGTLSTNFAHLPDADFNGFIRNERQSSKHFANPDPGAKPGCNQNAIAPQFTKAGIDSHGNAQGRIIAARNGLVA